MPGALSPWHILIVVLVLVVLFGSTKLPTLARSLGRSARILKSEAKSLHDDEDGDDGTADSATDAATGEKKQVGETPNRTTEQSSAKQRQSTE